MDSQRMKDWTVLILALGLMGLLLVITIGDFYVALEEKRPVDESVINLLSMAVTGIVGIVAGYVTGKSNSEGR
jgi:hypothetical protein|tara:strand:+ start:37 stop:255 length:219 start_codon:yes stop_codon:yes gene_type:complete